RYSWLAHIKDADGHPEGHPEYDPRTLYIPPSAWRSMSSFEKQYWEVKCTHWDSLVFFKKGKFYELYEKDARIAHQEFGWKITDRVNMAMAGVPESKFEFWASQAIGAGYKVARVDQLETALGKSLRDRGELTPVKAAGAASDKIIRRELTCVLTCGTLTDPDMLTSDMHTYCLALRERIACDPVTKAETVYVGVAFVDTATAAFSLTWAADGMDRIQLETLLLQLTPREVVLVKGQTSASTMRLLRSTLPAGTVFNTLSDGKEFWDAETTRRELRQDAVFGLDEAAWPAVLQTLAAAPLALSSLGGLISYLRDLKIDGPLLSARNFTRYHPLHQRGQDHLILDGQTLLNLEIFHNSADGTARGTLFEMLNHCITPAGKRKMQRWICHPLRHPAAISARLNAIHDLEQHPELYDFLHRHLAKLPDLERIVCRVHAGTCSARDFVTAVHTFERLLSDLWDRTDPWLADATSLESTLLQALLQGRRAPMPAVRAALAEIQARMHLAQSSTENAWIARSGHNALIDQAQAGVDAIEQEMDQYRRDQARALACRDVVYHHHGKELFQLEVPAKIKVPASWIKMGHTQKITRYWNPTLSNASIAMQEANERLQDALRVFRLEMMQFFDTLYSAWLDLVDRTADLDCLMSLFEARRHMGYPNCRPELVEAKTEAAIFECEGLRHPLIGTAYAMAACRRDPIPNDIVLADPGASSLDPGSGRIALITGPNMGGKSTTLRQTCIAAILAQIGSYVPATRCRLSPIDQIFCRLGASDNIMKGHSTFMVELTETAKILQEATPQSLVVLDELGRGTSTFDGYAIAYATLMHLALRNRCLGLFSTHYHTLCDDVVGVPVVRPMYMDFEANPATQDITFLYKLVPGVCHESHGMRVAAMAGLPSELVAHACRMSRMFQ
ncbi:hypothetical protein CXG81DRAFT_2665, partial [Caulochytrium protostelioides]